jgi:hypothetical protein
MGGISSGRGLYALTQTTSSYYSIDIRQLKQATLLTPGQTFDWKWIEGGKATASIKIQIEQDRVILGYRHCTLGQDWKDKKYPMYLILESLPHGWKAPVVHLSNPGLRKKSRHSLWWRYLRLPALL